MFFGKEKEHVFPLLVGEEQVDELRFEQYLFFVLRGVTRVTLTTHRVLYSSTRVFTPVYWLLLLLCGLPLIFYYAFRISRNRNVSMPLGSIESTEKRYFPNWALLIVVIVAGFFAVNLCAMVATAFDPGQDQTSNSADPSGDAQLPLSFGRPREATRGVVSSLLHSLGGSLGLLVGAVAGPALLVLLLATRAVGIEVRSSNNKFSFGAGSEERLDAFVQKMHAEMERARRLQTPVNSIAS